MTIWDRTGVIGLSAVDERLHWGTKYWLRKVEFRPATGRPQLQQLQEMGETSRTSPRLSSFLPVDKSLSFSLRFFNEGKSEQDWNIFQIHTARSNWFLMGLGQKITKIGGKST